MADFDREYDPLTGLVTDIGVEDGKLNVRYLQNTQAAGELNRAKRDDDGFTKLGIKKDLVQVVHLTDVDCMRLIVEDGIDPYTCKAGELKSHLYKHRDKWGHVFTTRGRF